MLAAFFRFQLKDIIAFRALKILAGLAGLNSIRKSDPVKLLAFHIASLNKVKVTAFCRGFRFRNTRRHTRELFFSQQKLGQGGFRLPFGSHHDFSDPSFFRFFKLIFVGIVIILDGGVGNIYFIHLVFNQLKHKQLLLGILQALKHIGAFIQSSFFRLLIQKNPPGYLILQIGYFFLFGIYF